MYSITVHHIQDGGNHIRTVSAIIKNLKIGSGTVPGSPGA